MNVIPAAPHARWVGVAFGPSGTATDWAEGVDVARGDALTFSVTIFSSDTSGARKSEL